MILFADAGHFVSYHWVSGPHNILVILRNLLKTKKIVHQQKQKTNESNKKFKTADLAWMLRRPHEILLRAAPCLKLCAVLTYLDLKMGNNKTENTKKQGKCEKTAVTPNNGKIQTTDTAGNYEAWQPLTPQKPVGCPKEVLEKLNSLDAKMSGLETLPKKCVILQAPSTKSLVMLSFFTKKSKGLWNKIVL